jgi:hypothetical protein
MFQRALGVVAALLTLTLGGAVTTAPGAAATEAASGVPCSPGYACVLDASGLVIYRSAGNTGTISVTPGGSGGHVWNNGVRYPGLDHIQLSTRSGSTRLTICLHYGPKNLHQPDPTLGTLTGGETVTGWRWRGECVGNEDVWTIVR